VKTSISLMVWFPAKSTSSQSGYAAGVPSVQPPPLPQFTPLRSPLMAPSGPYPEPKINEAKAEAPLEAAATVTWVAVVEKLHHALLFASVKLLPVRARTCHQYVVPGAKPPTNAVVAETGNQKVSQLLLLIVSMQYS